jgi:N-acetylglucosamine-6-sulfatase
VGGGCSGPAWRTGAEQKTFAARLKKSGYTTMYAGKYLNQYGRPGGGGLGHVPPGWDWWAGLVGNSRYYNYTLSINGKAERHGATYARDYLTDVIRRKAVQFLDHVAKLPTAPPFLMVLAPPACHAPFTPAPQYRKHFSNLKAPRTPAFNRDKAGDPRKHWLVETEPRKMSNETVARVDKTFRDRWRTLLSVDDLIRKVHAALAGYGMLDNTYLLFTSDHGYHLGQVR